MQVGVIGGICLLAFLLSEGRAEELDSLKESKVLQDVNNDNVKEAVVLRKSDEAPSDLKSEISLAVTQSNSQVSNGRSGDASQSDARSFEDSAVSNAIQSSGYGSASAYADRFGGSAQSRATVVAGEAPVSPFNSFNEELGTYIPPGSSFSQAEVQAINSDSYGQELKSFPYPASYPYSSGLSSTQAQADNGLYQLSPNLNPKADSGLYQRDPVYNPYGEGLSPGQAQYQADNGLYQPGYIGPPNMSTYNQGSSYPPGQADSESNQPIIETNSMLPKPVPRLKPVLDSFSASPSSYPYSPGSSLSSTYTLDNTGPYQPVPIPDPNFSPYESFLVPYKGPSSAHTQGISKAYQPEPIIKSKEDRYESNSRPYSLGQNQYDFASSHSYGQNEPYRAVHLPDPNPSIYDSFLVPYRERNLPQAQTDNDPHQPIPIPKTSNKQQKALTRLNSDRSYSAADYPSTHFNGFFIHNSAQPPSPADRGLYQTVPNTVSYIESSFSEKQINNGPYQRILIPNNSLRMKSTQDEIQPYQSIPVPNSDSARYESSMDQFREQSSGKIKVQSESNTYEYQPVPNTNEPKSDVLISSASTNNVGRSREYASAIDDTDSSPDTSKSGWDPYEYNPYATSGPYPQLYPSGADAAQAYSDFKPAASGVPNPYSQGISPYESNYPSESPVRAGGYNPSENEVQGPPNVFASGQSSPIAFEDAKSRAILPYEYVFPNKMPGGENVVQCTKENEFHHFWSPELDCMVCICLNEYGVLQPVCASCGGCHNPPPKLPQIAPRLPVPIPVQPATNLPFKPKPIMPDPYPPVPQPEHKPEPPVQEPYQPVLTPEPYPMYPELVPPPSPVLVTFPEPVATLPPLPAQAHCNPLPTGVPFTNPLHPCQICICRESFVTGKNDVQIECKENPQCIAPADVTALPPISDVPMPIPLPICEKFPEDVLFPHPTEACKLCKCAKSLSEDGVYEQQITCYPHPDCVPKLEAVTELPVPVDPYQVKPYPEPEPVSIEPLREPYQPMEPVPLPEVVTVEPLPWPPITTISPVPELPMTPRPGALPGPSPHESCQPYPPNQTFQHPWDECQVCVCTEATAIGLITVEVNCYTKPYCCIDPPDSVKAALPGNLQIFIGFNMPYAGLGNALNSPGVQALSSGSQPITSTYRPAPAYPSYSPRSVNVYPGSNQATDPLNQASPYAGYVDPPSSYPYQPNYATPYVNPLYPEYPPRLPVLPATGNTIGQYKPNNFGYPANYQYAQGDAAGNTYPPHRQGHYQPFDPRFQTVQAPSYPGLYQRAYERPRMYAPQLRDGYVKPLVPALGGPIQNLSPSYATLIGYSKSGKDGPDDDPQ